MNGKSYDLDLQNKMEGSFWDLEDGIRVQCWKSLPTRVRETDRFVTPFQARPCLECDHEEGKIVPCKKVNQTLPIVSYATDDIHYVATPAH